MTTNQLTADTPTSRQQWYVAPHRIIIPVTTEDDRKHLAQATSAGVAESRRLFTRERDALEFKAKEIREQVDLLLAELGMVADRIAEIEEAEQ